jgi:hypothetical protein
MRNTDTLVIAEFGSYRIDAEFTYTINLTHHPKHAPITTNDIKIENIELTIHKHTSIFDRNLGVRTQTWKQIRRTTLLDIPGWLYTLLTDSSTLECLDIDLGPDPDDARDRALEDRALFPEDYD